MGSRRKRLSMFEDEIEHTDRRRSNRIIALEEKKQEERDRKLALALARKNNSGNHDNRNIEKGKEKINVADDLDDSDSDSDYDYDEDEDEDEEHGPTKKCRKRKALRQLISSTKDDEHSHSTSRTNVSSPKSTIPEKHVLELIIDTLQRKDPEELFAEPVNPDVVEDYYQIVKQPMDFGTMRAKLHENMYTNLEQFKRDVYLICSNAMNVNPASSREHKVAEVIQSHARRVFDGLSADPEQFDFTFSLNKRRSNRNSQDRQPRTSRSARAPPKPPGRKKATNSVVLETERRDMYCPPSNNTLVSEFINVNKFNIQLNKDASNYRDSLLQFVADMGETPQKVAAKKLEALNLLENVAGTEIIPHPTTQAPTQQDTPNHVDRLSLALTIPGTTAQGNRNSNTIVGGVDINESAHQGNNTCVDNNNWNAQAAAILGNIFINNDKGKRHSGFESSNARGTMDIWGSSKGKMVSSLQLGANTKGKIDQWNNYAGIPNRLATESSRSVLVWPTQVIQPKPLESKYGNSNSGLSFIRQPRQEDSMPNTNLLGLSLVPHQQKPTTGLSLATQPRAEHSISVKPTINLTSLSPVPQQRTEHSMSGINHSSLSFRPQLKVGESSNHSNNISRQSILPSNAARFSTGLSLASQPRQKHSMSGINHSSLSLMPHLKLGESSNPSNNISGKSIFPSQAAQFSNWNQPDTSLFGSGTPYQHGDYQAIMGSSSTHFNNTPYYPLQKSHEQVLKQSAPASSYTPSATSFDLQMKLLGQQNLPGLFPRNEPKISLDLGMPSGSAVNYYGGGAAPIGQPQEATQQLLWDNDQQITDLSLQL